MKRIAMVAVLAAAATSVAPLSAVGQVVHGYKKSTMKDRTLPSSRASKSLQPVGRISNPSETQATPAVRDQGPASEDDFDYTVAGAANDGYGSAYGAQPPYSPAVYSQMATDEREQAAMDPNAAAMNGYGAPPAMLAYPGYAPTPENMLYGGSPYPQMVPAGYDGMAEYGGMAAPGSAGRYDDYGSMAGGGMAGGCGGAGCGHAGCSHCGRACRPMHWFIGYDATADWVGACRRGYATVEYLNWWVKGQNAPPLLTTSPTGTPQAQAGVIGQPGTTVLFGGEEIDDDGFSGGRVALGWWLMHAEYIGFELSYTGFESGGTNFNESSTFSIEMGDNILAIPFFNTNTGVEDSLVLAFPDFVAGGGLVDGGGATVDLDGAFTYDSDIQIHSTSALFKSVVWVHPDMGFRMFFLGGYRFFWLSDDVDITGIIAPSGGPFAAGSRIIVNDQFETENQFHGGDLGLQTEFANGPWSLGVLTKVGLGNMRHTLDINGSTTVTDGATAVFQGGLFSQPSNIGSSSNDEFAVIPEATLQLGYQLTRNIKVMGGYNFLYINKVVRAAEQIDRSINPTQFEGGLLVGEARPARNIDVDDFFMHGLSTGIEIKW